MGCFHTPPVVSVHSSKSPSAATRAPSSLRQRDAGYERLFGSMHLPTGVAAQLAPLPGSAHARYEA